jgi:hypothetical protein
MMLNHNKMKKLASSALIWLRNASTSVSARIVLVSGLIVGTVTFLGAILKGKEYLTSLGLIDIVRCK